MDAVRIVAGDLSFYMECDNHSYENNTLNQDVVLQDDKESKKDECIHLNVKPTSLDLDTRSRSSEKKKEGVKEEIFKKAGSVACCIAKNLQIALKEAKQVPKEYEIELHYSITASGEIFVLSSAAQTGITLRMKWENDDYKQGNNPE